jgi:hypothetical protein
MLSIVLVCWTLLITACKAGHPNSQQQPQAALVTACRTAGESTQRLKGGTCQPTARVLQKLRCPVCP